jgi:hypothetical protein
MVNSVLKLFGQSLFSTRTSVVFEVKRNQLRPRKIFFRFRWMNVRFEVAEIVL